MELLLTSSGITTPAIAERLNTMSANTNRKVGFISTAANVEAGDKDWYINQILDLRRFGYRWIDFVDPSAPGVDWQGRLEQTDILFMSGGNTFHLLDQVRKTGFDEWLKSRLDKVVYVGASAGSIIVTPDISISTLGGDANTPSLADRSGMGLVDFEISPHATPDSTRAQTHAPHTTNKLYAIGDDTAIAVHGDGFRIIGEQYWEYN